MRKKPNLPWIYALAALGLFVSPSWAQESAATPPALESTPVALPSAPGNGLSKGTEAPMEQAAPTLNQKPSQDEGAKAPAAAKPTEVPDFSLPDVVITGDNELTIGAKRLERPEEDVTLGTRDLGSLNRSSDDLPGLEKTLTATSTEDTGASRNSALVLHLGGGDEGTFGGWGLAGQSFTGFQYLLSGGYSHWDGERAGALGLLDGEETYHAGLDAQIAPEGPLKINLAGKYQALNAPLPYQGVNERHQGLDLRAGLDAKLSGFEGLGLRLEDQWTQLTDWDLGLGTARSNEFQGTGLLFFNELGPFFKDFSVEGGLKVADASGLPAGAASRASLGWVEPSVGWKLGDAWALTTRLQAQAGGGFDLPLRLYPSADLTWDFLQSAQLELTYVNQRSLADFYQTYLGVPHLSDAAGFSSPEETVNQVGLKWTQKVSEQCIFSIFGSDETRKQYHQWSDLLPLGSPAYLQRETTLGSVELTKAGANFQFDFDRNLALSSKIQWQKGVNQSDGRNLTDLPDVQWWISLLKTEAKWDAELGIHGAGARKAFETLPGELPAYGTLTFSGDYHLDRGLGLWVSAENPLGTSIQSQPGYDDPKFYVQAGLEFIF
ncbi:MAG TPA: hypothetical protein VMU88_01975 [bacterium]|nr:hypothetical protein [bacterium]